MYITLVCVAIMAAVWAQNTTDPEGPGDRLSPPLHLHEGAPVEPVIFEPLPKIRLSRSTYTLTTYVNFQPLLESMVALRVYIESFVRDIRDPRYVSVLKAPIVVKNPETGGIIIKLKIQCPNQGSNLTYECRIANQYLRMVNESLALQQSYMGIYEHFLNVIDHKVQPSQLIRKRRSIYKREHKRVLEKAKLEKYLHSKNFGSPNGTQNEKPIGHLGANRHYLTTHLLLDQMESFAKLLHESCPSQARCPYLTPFNHKQAHQSLNLVQARVKRNLMEDRTHEDQPEPPVYFKNKYQHLNRDTYNLYKDMWKVMNMIQNHNNSQSHRWRVKRFGFITLLVGLNSWRNSNNIRVLKRNVEKVYKMARENREKLNEIAHHLNMTMDLVNEHSEQLLLLDKRLTNLENAVGMLTEAVSTLRYIVLIMGDINVSVHRIQTGILQTQIDINSVEEYLRVMATEKPSPLVIAPNRLREVLVRVKEHIKPNPRLALPENPDEDIWSYYSFMRITPVMTNQFLVVVIAIPLVDQSLQLDLYKVHNLPAIHPELKIEFQYQLEGSYLAVHRHGFYVAMPTEQDIGICQATEGYICVLNQALYPIDTCNWCVYAHFSRNSTAIQEHCLVDTIHRQVNRAQSLQGYMWAVSILATQRIQIRCLPDTHVVTVHPPMTIINIPDGCEGYSPSIYIPAKSEIAELDNNMERRDFFMTFNDPYQNISRYGLFVFLNLTQMGTLTPGQIQSIQKRYRQLAPMSPKLLQEAMSPDLEEYPWSVPEFVHVIIMAVGGAICIGVIVFLIYLYLKHRGMVTLTQPLQDMLNGDGNGKVQRLIRYIVPTKDLRQEPSAPPVEVESDEDTPSTGGATSSIPLKITELSKDTQPTVSRLYRKDPLDLFQQASQELEQEGYKMKQYKKYLQKRFGNSYV